MAKALLIQAFMYTTMALYSMNSKVHQLSSSTFDQIVLQGKKAYFVEFYSPKCGYCVQLAPVWQNLADNISSHVGIAAIDCSKHSDICNRYQIRGYPTLKMFSLSPADDKRYIVDYDGQREVNPLADFAKRHSTSFVYLIRPNPTEKDRTSNKRMMSMDEFMQKGKELPRVIFFKAEKPQVVSLPLKSLSTKYFKKILVAQVGTQDASDLIKQYSLPSSKDSIVILSPLSGISKHIVYDGPMTHSALDQFFAKYQDLTVWDKSDL